MWVNADHGRDFHPLADHMTNKKNFTKEENHAFSAFRFSLQLMLEQFNSLSDDFTNKLHIKLAQTSYHVAVDTR